VADRLSVDRPGAVAIQHWDEPLVHIPDRDALTLYLRGRGLPAQNARAAAQELKTPMTITKRGMIGWIRMTPAADLSSGHHGLR
jgi:hypothetical protein